MAKPSEPPGVQHGGPLSAVPRPATSSPRSEAGTIQVSATIGGSASTDPLET